MNSFTKNIKAIGLMHYFCTCSTCSKTNNVERVNVIFHFNWHSSMQVLYSYSIKTCDNSAVIWIMSLLTERILFLNVIRLLLKCFDLFLHFPITCRVKDFRVWWLSHSWTHLFVLCNWRKKVTFDYCMNFFVELKFWWCTFLWFHCVMCTKQLQLCVVRNLEQNLSYL